VIAKVEWPPGELYPRVGVHRHQPVAPAERVVVFCNKRGTCEQWIKGGKEAIKWTRLSCRSFAANTVRLQLHAQAYNLSNFLARPFLESGLPNNSENGYRKRRFGSHPGESR
jgi:hypothetical protein